MALKFITGLPGTGKTTCVLSEIRQKLNTNTPLYYLVPEQFSLQSEKLLLTGDDFQSGKTTPPPSAATQVQVLSFNRLAHRLFAELGGLPGQLVDDLGKQMLVRKILFEISDQLIFYKYAAGMHGFVDDLSRTITEMNHYGVSSGDLLIRAQDDEFSTLSAKLSDMALILSTYRTTVKGKYLLTDDILELLCEKIENSPNPITLLDGAFFWLDGFSGFTPQERRVLKNIMKRAENVSITLTISENNYISHAPTETIAKITKLAHENNIPILETENIDENKRHKNAPGLSFFVKNYGNREKFHTSSNNIEIISASDRYAVVYAAAFQIHKWVTNDKMRFRDIAILCGDRARYEKILQTVFDHYKIPMFVDTETDILSHPLTEMIRAALCIPAQNWNYESVFRFLKTSLTGIDNSKIDILENYVLANGINSFRWQYNFKTAAAESCRLEVLQALNAFEKIRADSKDTVKNHSQRVFDMLYQLNIPSQLQAWFDERMKVGDPDSARIHGQIWQKICEVIDKLVEILGSEVMTLKDYADTLDAGLFQSSLGRIPPTTNQVILGDTGRSRYPEIKAMLVLGANEGVLPPTPTQTGLFTDHERKLLLNSALSLEVAPDNRRRIKELDYGIFCALSQPKEKLVFIYAETEPSGKPLRVSPIIKRIREMFPKIETTPAPPIIEFTSKTTLPPIPDNLSAETAAELFGKTLYTAATRLEAYARCPYQFFINYILSARPRERYQVLPTDLGKLFHEALAIFTHEICTGEVNPNNVTRTDIDAKINEITDKITPDDSIFHDSARGKHILNKVRRVAATSCWAACENIKRGDYFPIAAEHEISSQINTDDGKQINLSGRVDRVDISKDGEVQIIDYKSGTSKFNPDDVRRGIQLQLLLYMNAIIESRKAEGIPANPGGVFYFPINDPVLNTDVALSDTDREEGLLKSFKPSGVTIGDAKPPTGITPSEFETLRQIAVEKAKDITHRLTQGEIAPAPYTKGAKTPCRYCAFDAVCGV